MQPPSRAHPGKDRDETAFLKQFHKSQPALPKDWPDGSVSGLKTRGGFRVSIAWKSGELISATIQSTTGRETKVRYRDQITPVTLKPGDTFRLK